MKNRKTKLMLAGALAFTLSLCPLANTINNGSAYAIDAEAEPEFSAEEAQKAAEKLVTAIQRLERTEDYQKHAAVFKALYCLKFDSDYRNCTQKTSVEDVRKALMEVVPADQRAEVSQVTFGDINLGSEGNPWNVVQKYMIWYQDWLNLYEGIDNTYVGLKHWAADDNGITNELTVENVARAMQKAGSSVFAGQYNWLSPFWDSLEILQAQTWTGKVGRLIEVLQNKPWVELAGVMKKIDDEGYWSADNYHHQLTKALMPFVGDTSSWSANYQVKVARDLSDYGQAQALYSVMSGLCVSGIDNIGDYRCEVIWNLKNNYSEEGQKNAYENLQMHARILYPDITNNLFNYKLTLASLPQDGNNIPPALPNTGANNGEDVSAIVVKIAVAGVAAAMTMAGVVVIAKRFLFSPLKRKR